MILPRYVWHATLRTVLNDYPSIITAFPSWHPPFKSLYVLKPAHFSNTFPSSKPKLTATFGRPSAATSTRMSMRVRAQMTLYAWLAQCRW